MGDINILGFRFRTNQFITECGKSSLGKTLTPKGSIVVISAVSLVACIVDMKSAGMFGETPFKEALVAMRHILLTLFQMANMLLLLSAWVSNPKLIDIYVYYTLGFVIFGVIVAMLEFLATLGHDSLTWGLLNFIFEVAFLFVIFRCLPLVDDYRRELLGLPAKRSVTGKGCRPICEFPPCKLTRSATSNRSNKSSESDRSRSSRQSHTRSVSPKASPYRIPFFSKGTSASPKASPNKIPLLSRSTSPKSPSSPKRPASPYKMPYLPRTPDSTDRSDSSRRSPIPRRSVSPKRAPSSSRRPSDASRRPSESSRKPSESSRRPSKLSKRPSSSPSRRAPSPSTRTQAPQRKISAPKKPTPYQGYTASPKNLEITEPLKDICHNISTFVSSRCVIL